MVVRAAQEELLGAILNHAPVGVAVLTTDDLTYEFLNPGYQAIAPDKPMLGRRYAEVWPEVADTIVPLVREVAETGQPWIGENLPLEIHRMPGQAREVVYFTFGISRLEIAGEAHILVTVYEVTHEVEARRRIEGERALLQAVLQAMNEAVIISDAEANVLDMNAEALRLTGFENMEQVRRNLKAWPEYELRTLEGELLGIDDWPLGRVTRGEGFTNLVLHVLNRTNGERRVWRYSGSPVFDAGKLVRTVLTFSDVTEEHAAQEDLRESEQRFRSVLENSLDAAYRRELRTDSYDYLSPVIEQITGFSPGEFATLPLEEVLERIHPDDVRLVKEALPDALQTGRLTVEYRFRRKDDRYVWLADNAAVVKDAEGKPLYLSGVVRDSTSRKQLEEQAQREHRRLRALLDTLPVAVFISDAQGGLVYTNEQVTELWGELPATPSVDEYGLYKARRADTGERLKAEDWSGARALQGEPVLGEVLEIERFDGGHRTTLNSSVPIRDEQGTIIGQVTVEQDITERRRAEQALRESEERLRLALDAARMVAWEYDPDTLKVTMSENAEEVLGLPRRHEDSDEGYGLIHPDDVEHHRALVNEAISAGRSYASTYRHERGEEEIWLEEHGRAVADAEGKIVRLVGVVQNVSESKRAHDALSLQAHLSEAINEIDADVASTLDAGEIMSRVVERTARTVGADVGAIYLPVDGEWEAHRSWQAPAWLAGARLRGHQMPFSMHAATERRAVLLAEPSKHPGWGESIARRLNARQVLDAPLILGGDETGHLALYKVQGGDFTEADRDFLQKVSAAVSLALQNARRYERERDIADTLQEALLALPEEIPGVEFAHAYRSASEASRVGGDFYDIFPLRGHLVAIIVGDVAGKGLDASALTSLVKNAIRAHATEKGAAPGRILALTNDVVFDSTMSDSFVTVFFGVLDCRSGRLLYASAGHTTGAMVSQEGRVTELPATGPVIGAFPSMSFDEAERQLDLDTTLFLYTDGLTEARRGDELFGEDRLFDLLGRRRAGKPAQIVRYVIEEVLGFAGGQLNDDLAVLALKQTRAGERPPHPEKVQV